ncbi:pilin/secretion family protein with methylation motif [Roseiarcus fermentans]|uniref:Pilin/secretion family protein with methylation motif n=1 Tax=Roseiarcus fermentans TaxID=1473586 RepID=A0A366EQG0_9HYPH|nr:prepilin-type N-terminal cleavage/methylation domain-containing protein [Roseiarcus fermentans]RBP04653.1 pilin/secretion family protein with methylation motif [Roseiarcus fermentans]
MFHSSPRPSSCSRGFTLVESLVALTVMMIVLSAIGRLGASSLRAGRYVEGHLADIENVQQILAVLPGRNDLANGAATGELAGRRWRLDVAPFSAEFVDPHAPTRWAPETIVLTVQGPGGVPLRFDMVRLVKTGAK